MKRDTLNIAQGSLEESRDHLILAKDPLLATREMALDLLMSSSRAPIKPALERRFPLQTPVLTPFQGISHKKTLKKCIFL